MPPIYFLYLMENTERYMTFRAPWSRKLSYSTLIFILILFAVSTLGRSELHRHGLLSTFMTTGIPLLLASGSSLFMIRGYIVTKRTLFVQRFFWHSRIDLSELRSYEIDPTAMRRSVRNFGNGGLFCIAGYFYNDRLGKYRAFATDPSLSVVLHFPDRTVVVTPDNPKQFVAALREIVAV